MLTTITHLLRAARKLHAIHHSRHKHILVGHHLELLGALTIVAKSLWRGMSS